MTPEAMKALIHRAAVQPWNDGNLAPLEEGVAANYKSHSNSTDKAALKRNIEMTRLAFPDLHITVEEQIVEGDKIVTRWLGRGTHEGTYLGVPGTGKKMEQAGITIAQIADGKIVAEWAHADELGILRQLGILPRE
jgi:steroid delta-isomerase-like uncharacterized protein